MTRILPVDPDRGDPDRRDLSVSMLQATWMSSLFALPPILLSLAVYISRWGVASIAHGLDALAQHLLVFLGAFMLGILIHEAIHGMGWLYFGKKPFNAIQFGFQWQSLTPYAHLTEPIDIRAYRWSAVLPAILVGAIPAVASIIAGAPLLLFFGLAFLLGAGGDFYILWLIRSVPSGNEVIDHPTRVGCFILGEGE